MHDTRLQLRLIYSFPAAMVPDNSQPTQSIIITHQCQLYQYHTIQIRTQMFNTLAKNQDIFCRGYFQILDPLFVTTFPVFMSERTSTYDKLNSKTTSGH